MKLVVGLRTVGLSCVGWSHPTALEADVPFTKRAVESGELVAHEVYIPGSSFKGALRSAASRVAEAYGFTSCGEVKPQLIEKAHGSGGICDVCKLFGYPKSKSQAPLFVSDLEPVGQTQSIVVTRVRLDDQTLKVAEGALFTTEHILPSAEFKGTILVHGAEPRLLRLLLLALAELRLGRFGRRSLVDLKIEEDVELERELEGAWLELLNDLRRWLWLEVL